MIAYLKGEIIKKTIKGIILNTNNVGYFVYLTKILILEIKENQPIELFIHTHIRDDASELYGFLSYEDLEFFTQLLNVRGIGPKVALEILSVPQEKIKAAILNEDETFLCQTPGIGKKTAKRLIIELKDKIDANSLTGREYRSIKQETHKEAIDALVRLGYQRHEIIKIIKEMPEEIQKAEEIITYFLKNI